MIKKRRSQMLDYPPFYVHGLIERVAQLGKALHARRLIGTRLNPREIHFRGRQQPAKLIVKIAHEL